MSVDFSFSRTDSSIYDLVLPCDPYFRFELRSERPEESLPPVARFNLSRPLPVSCDFRIISEPSLPGDLVGDLRAPEPDLVRFLSATESSD